MKKEIKGENVTNKNLVTIKIKQRKEPITGLYVNHDNNWVAVLENTYDYVLDGYTFINREWIDHFHIETDRIADYIFSNSKWKLINSTLLFPPALFDKDKLHNICKNELSKLSEDELYDFLYNWASENAPEKKDMWFADKEKMLAILRLYMGIGMKRRRKDFMYAKQIFNMISYFFDGESTDEKDEFRLDMSEVKNILNDYMAAYNHDDDNSAWFNKLKEIADKHGYASDMKAYKASPESFKGNVSDIAEVVRIAVTGRANTPDLWSIVHIMGEEQMKQRIEKVINR